MMVFEFLPGFGTLRALVSRAIDAGWVVGAVVAAVVLVAFGLWAWPRRAELRFYNERRLFWWQRRRPVAEFDTRIYIGRPGAGKTLFCVRDAIELLRQEVRVAANFKVRDPISGRETEPIRSWLDFLRLSVEAIVTREPLVFIIDEINQWAPARFYQKVPGWWLTLMSQRRHFGVGIIASAQNFEGVEVYLRRLVNTIVFLRALPVSVPVINRGELRMARLPFFFAAALDPQAAEQAAAVSTDASGAQARARMPLGSLTHMSPAVYGAYSTAEIIAVEEWAETDDINAMVMDMMTTATAYNKLIYLPAIGEDHASVSENLEYCRGCFRLVDCEAISNVLRGEGCPMAEGAAIAARVGLAAV